MHECGLGRPYKFFFLCLLLSMGCAVNSRCNNNEYEYESTCDRLYDSQVSFLDKIKHITVISSVFVILVFPLRIASPLTDSLSPVSVLTCSLAVTGAAELDLSVP